MRRAAAAASNPSTHWLEPQELRVAVASYPDRAGGDRKIALGHIGQQADELVARLVNANEPRVRRHPDGTEPGRAPGVRRWRRDVGDDVCRLWVNPIKTVAGFDPDARAVDNWTSGFGDGANNGVR